MGLFNRREAGADLKCEGKELSESYKLILGVIGVMRRSMQSFTKLVGIGPSQQNKTAHIIDSDTN